MMHTLRWAVTLLALHQNKAILLLIIGLLKISWIFVDSQRENSNLKHSIRYKNTSASSQYQISSF